MLTINIETCILKSDLNFNIKYLGFKMKSKALELSAAQVLHIAENLYGSPEVIPAAHLLAHHHVNHLETRQPEGKQGKVQQVEYDDVESPTYNIVLRVEYVKDEHDYGHGKVHC
jgi:hypothetical protein